MEINKKKKKKRLGPDSEREQIFERKRNSGGGHLKLEVPKNKPVGGEGSTFGVIT
jgi:hypothetical protein